MLVEHTEVDQSKAEAQLGKHLYSGDLSDLNRRQRIILASHRFAPEVTSAVLWINEQARNSDLITCVKLIPYFDQDTLYIQAATILPIPDTAKFQVGIGPSSGTTGGSRQQDDAITHFMYEVDTHVVNQLDPSLRPDKTSRWAGVYSNYRYYHFRYFAAPWNNWSMKFEINLYDADETGTAQADVGLSCDKKSLQREAGFGEAEYSQLKNLLNHVGRSESESQFRLHDDYPLWDGMWLGTSVRGKAMTNEFRETIQATVVHLIKTVKPAIDNLVTEWNER